MQVFDFIRRPISRKFGFLLIVVVFYGWSQNKVEQTWKLFPKEVLTLMFQPLPLIPIYFRCKKIKKNKATFSRLLHNRRLLLNYGTFNNYVDKVLPNFDPLPPRVDNCGHFTWYLAFVMWPSVDFSMTASPPPFLVHVVIEWPLNWLATRANRSQSHSNNKVIINLRHTCMTWLHFIATLVYIMYWTTKDLYQV